MTDPGGIVIVGAGMQGATLALTLHERGVDVTVVDRHGVSTGASGNSYGIIHGGLRYLQTLDIPRWRRSRRAQAWFLHRYADRVRPLECVMPLYRGCVRSRAAFRLAGAMDDVLAATLGPRVPLPRLRLIGADAVRARFPIPTQGLTGAAIWHDAATDSIEDLVTAILRDAGVEGERLMLATRADRLILAHGRVAGLEVSTGDGIAMLAAAAVVDCGGAGRSPLVRESAGNRAVLAYNLVLDLPWADRAALAVSVRPGRGRSYFVRGTAEGMAFVGTFYRLAVPDAAPEPDARDIAEALAVLDHALPGCGFARASVTRVLAGLLPPADDDEAEPSGRDHVAIGTPPGYARILGCKLTTAPVLSEQVTDRIMEMVR